MKKTRGFLLAAGISLALAFTFSCSSDDGEPSGGNTSSSSVVGGGGGSSSSGDGGGSSSSGDGTQGGVVYGDSVTYNGETYRTVVIGTQTWFARNLNYNANGSKCYNDDLAKCNIYGRLYDWSTAMDIDGSYNRSSWGGSDVKHRGICPQGWHLPSNEDWDKLYRFADGASGTESPYDSRTAGKYLKATTGWNDYNGASGNGTDKYGFSALPGGLGGSDGYFYSAGDYGLWWSSSEDNSFSAFYRSMYYNGESAGWDIYNNNKSYLFSVRCLQD